MESIYGSNNWKLTLRREAGGVTLLRAVTCDARAALPDTLFGLPVTALGEHALAANAPAPEGEALSIIGAPAAGDWDNQSLRELTLPQQLGRAGDYALMNCRALQTLRLSDRPIAWGTGALMNCRALDTLLIERCGGNAGDAVAYFSGELSGELDVSILSEGKLISRLIIPDYYEEYVENSPAHHFDYKVHGGGQPYHHIFRDRTLNCNGFDALWPALLSGEHEPDAALRLAWWRICCPEGLSAEAASRYRRYLSAHAEEALVYVLSLRDTALLRTLLDRVDCTGEALHAAAERARQAHDTAAAAVLLEAQHRKAGAEKSFEL